MYKNSYQHGLLTIFSSAGANPMLIWGVHVKNGHIATNIDQDIKSQVVDIIGTNVSTTYITCPKNPKQTLGIHLPYLVMILKNLHKYFTFEITILDESDCRRRFRVSNFQSTTTIHPFCTAMPIGLSGGWNQIQFNLAEFTRRAYKLQFAEVLKVQINANVRLKRIYFTERLYAEDELPTEYKLFFPIKASSKRPKKAIVEEPPPAPVEEKAPSKTSVHEEELGDLAPAASIMKDTRGSQILPKASMMTVMDTEARPESEAGAAEGEAGAAEGESGEAEGEAVDGEQAPVLSVTSLHEGEARTASVTGSKPASKQPSRTGSVGGTQEATQEEVNEEVARGAAPEGAEEAKADEPNAEPPEEGLTAIKEETESATKVGEA